MVDLNPVEGVEEVGEALAASAFGAFAPGVGVGAVAVAAVGFPFLHHNLGAFRVYGHAVHSPHMIPWVIGLGCGVGFFLVHGVRIAV